MRRRHFFLLLGSAAAWPLAAQAQQPERIRRIALLLGGANDTNFRRWLSVLQDGLGGLGWQLGKDIRLEPRFAVGDTRRVPSIATDLIQRNPDLIFTNNTPGALALLGETRTIPIVFTDVSDPVSSGLVSSLARPGKNATGISNFEPGIGGKWLEIIKSIVPQAKSTSLVFHWESAPHVGGYIRSLEAAANTFAMQLSIMPIHAVAEIDDVMIAQTGNPGGSVIVLPDMFAITNRRAIISSAARHRVPALYPYRVMATEGGLAAYGPDYVLLYRRAATYVDRILRGAIPSELPVQQPNKFELIINLKVANTLDLTVPPKLLARADEVIQ